MQGINSHKTIFVGMPIYPNKTLFCGALSHWPTTVGMLLCFKNLIIKINMERCQSGLRHCSRLKQFAFNSKVKRALNTRQFLTPTKPFLSGTPSHISPHNLCALNVWKIKNNLRFLYGEMSEWSNVLAWKAGVGKTTAGSNPVLSANESLNRIPRISVCFRLFLFFVLLYIR